MTARARKPSSFSSNSPVRLVEGLAANRHCMGTTVGALLIRYIHTLGTA